MHHLDPAGVVRGHHDRLVHFPGERAAALARGTPRSPPPRARAARAAASRLALAPLVLCSTSRSPGRQSASTWRAKICSNPRSLPAAVSSEVSVVSAIAASGRRAAAYRTTYSVARCCASAALPPLPQKNSVPPARSVSSVAPCRRGDPIAQRGARRGPSGQRLEPRGDPGRASFGRPRAAAAASASRSAGSRAAARIGRARRSGSPAGFSTVSSSACSTPSCASRKSPSGHDHAVITVVVAREDVGQPGRDQLPGALPRACGESKRGGVHLHRGAQLAPVASPPRGAAAVALGMRQERERVRPSRTRLSALLTVSDATRRGNSTRM